MTTDTVSLSGGLIGPARLDRGLSDVAGLLRNLWSDATDHSPSVQFEDRRRQLYEALISAFEAAAEEDWDGEGAAAADPLSLDYAVIFAETLPVWVPVPDVSVDPDGEMSLDWDRGRRSVFSVSIGPDGRLTYAGLFGAGKIRGVEPFTDNIPEVIIHGIRRAIA